MNAKPLGSTGRIANIMSNALPYIVIVSIGLYLTYEYLH
jgi:hypothetical protein